MNGLSNSHDKNDSVASANPLERNTSQKSNPRAMLFFENCWGVASVLL